MDAEKFGSFIQARRKELGLKQTDVAEKLYVTPKAVSRWERGVGFPDIRLLEPLAQTLEITLVELMHGEIMEQPEKCVDETVRMIKQKEKDQRWRKWINLSGTGILFCGLLFSLWAVRQVQWEEPWLLHVIRIVLVVGFGTAMRCWRYILEQWHLRSRPFGIWHSPYSYVMAAMEFAGALFWEKQCSAGTMRCLS